MIPHRKEDLTVTRSETLAVGLQLSDRTHSTLPNLPRLRATDRNGSSLWPVVSFDISSTPFVETQRGNWFGEWSKLLQSAVSWIGNLPENSPIPQGTFGSNQCVRITRHSGAQTLVVRAIDASQSSRNISDDAMRCDALAS